jgi:hypothetical protein
MKTTIKFLFVTIALGLASCSSDFLEKDPYGELTQEQILQEC